MDNLYDGNRLSGILFGSQVKSPPTSEVDVAKADAAEDQAAQTGGEGNTKPNVSSITSFHDDAESIITTSEVDSVVKLASDDQVSNHHDVVGVTESVSIELTSDVVGESDDETIVRLAALTPFEYDRIRLEEAERLGVLPKTLDAEVKASRNGDGNNGSESPFKDVEPYAQAVIPADLFNSISHGLRCFLIISEEQADAMALWVAHTYMVDLFDVSPLLMFNAPEKACAKTLAQTLIGILCFRPLPAANASLSALFRSVEWKPTILLDEVDTFLGSNPEAQGLINAGYKSGGFVLRSESTGDSFTPKMFPVFCAKSISGIALERHLPDSTLSRCIPINMRRKLPGETVERLRYADKGLFDVLRSKLVRFALDYAKQIRQARPSLPEELGDRAQDNWECLLAVASCGGPEWLERATKAAIELSGKDDDASSTSNELLTDIREIFEQKNAGKLCSADLIAALTTNVDMGWGTYNRGKPMTARQLAKQLAAYGIKSKNLRFQPATLKGYEKADFQEVFERYLAPPENPPQRSVSPEALQTEGSGAADENGGIRYAADEAQQDDDLTDADRAIAAFDADVAATPKPLPALGCSGAADAAANGGGDEDF